MTCDGRWLNIWDGENRLVSQQNVVSFAPNLLLEFRYDHRGRRIAKKVTDLGNNNNVLSNLRFAYDGWNLVAEFDVATGGSLSLARSYTWGPDLSNTLQGAGGVGGLLAARSGTADFYPCFDGNGNIIAWSDSQRQVRRRFDFDPFGNVTTTENSATPMPNIPLGFSTKYTDSETGLVYYIGRYYFPPLGRWLSMDPIAEEGGINLYGFVRNDGINRADYLGLDPGVAYPGLASAIESSTTQYLQDRDASNLAKTMAELERVKTTYENSPDETLKALGKAIGSVIKDINSHPASGTYEIGIQALEQWAIHSNDYQTNGTYNCNHFVANAVSAAGRKPPRFPRHTLLGFSRDASAREWYDGGAVFKEWKVCYWIEHTNGSDPSTKAPLVKVKLKEPSLGDIITFGFHIGVYLGSGVYVSSSTTTYSDQNPNGVAIKPVPSELDVKYIVPVSSQ